MTAMAWRRRCARAGSWMKVSQFIRVAGCWAPARLEMVVARTIAQTVAFTLMFCPFCSRCQWTCQLEHESDAWGGLLVGLGLGAHRLLRLDRPAQALELALVAAGEDREAEPGLGIEVEVVDVEGGRVTLAFPLVAREEAEEALHPGRHLRPPVRLEARGEQAVDLERRLLVADGELLDGVEHLVGHEVGLGSGPRAGGARLGGGALRGHCGECREGRRAGRPLDLQPAQPAAQEGLLGAADVRP